MRAPADHEPREVPNNIDLEQALFGAIFTNNVAFHNVSSFLRPEHFYDPLHQKLFEIITGVIAAGKVANPVTLKDHLSDEIKKLKINRLTIYQYLARLSAEATSVINAADYGRGIADLARRRRIIELAEDFAATALKDDDPELAIKARDAFGDIAKAAIGASQRFKLTGLDNLKSSTTVGYLVKGWFPRKGLVEVWGPPKCGKSFWVFTVMVHVALGREFRGQRVSQTEVIYLALEGYEGFSSRRDAFYKKYLKKGETVADFKLTGATLDLVKDHQQLISDIRQQSSSPGCIVIDTMNRSLVGSESKDEDMAAYLRAADALQHEFGCLVVIIHHCGIDESRPRGHSSQTGAVDVQISVKKDAATNVVTATVELAKDMPEGATIASQLHQVELGLDQDGDPITTCVLQPVEEAATAAAPKRKAKKLAPASVTALRAIKEAIAETGIVPPASNHIPDNTKGVTKEQWREYANRRGICTESGREGKTPDQAEKLLKEAQRKAFGRASAELIAAGQVGCWDDFYWLVKE